MMENECNKTVQQKLTRLIVEEIFHQSFSSVKVAVGPLMTNYFSFIFFIEVHTSRGTQKVFVKIPKEDLRKGSKTILPISTADRRMAEGEVDSLRTLSDQWQSEDLGVSWVRLRKFVVQYNAIVTDAVEGDDALAVFRKLDLRRRLGSKKDRFRLLKAMDRIGTALGRFHLRDVTEVDFLPALAAPKLLNYANEISKLSDSAWPSRVNRLIEQFGTSPIPGLLTTALKGIDVRNVLIDNNDHIKLLDPGRMKKACREDDIVRFLMTWRILYWGTAWFALGMEPDVAGETAFLEGYQESMSLLPSNCLLNFFMLKEILKHWHTAYIALSLKNWSRVIKRFVAVHYIDRFFELQLSKLALASCWNSPNVMTQHSSPSIN